MTILAALAMAAAGAQIALSEALHRFRFYGWPDNFNTASHLVLLAIMLLAAEAIIGLIVGELRRRAVDRAVLPD